MNERFCLFGTTHHTSSWTNNGTYIATVIAYANIKVAQQWSPAHPALCEACNSYRPFVTWGANNAHALIRWEPLNWTRGVYTIKWILHPWTARANNCYLKTELSQALEKLKRDLFSIKEVITEFHKRLPSRISVFPDFLLLLFTLAAWQTVDTSEYCIWIRI